MMDEDKLLLARADDLRKDAIKKETCVFTCFLSQREQTLLFDRFHNKKESVIFFDGLFKEAERKICAFCCNHTDAKAISFPAFIYKVILKSDTRYSHRDYLGALLSLGISRDRVGDIFVFDGFAYVALHHDISQHVLYNLRTVGKQNVKEVIRCEGEAPQVERQYLLLRSTIASARLDCVLAALLKTSRSKASVLLSEEKVLVDGRVIKSADFLVSEQKVLSIRGFGRFKIDKIGPVTKKGRLIFEALKYI